MIRRTQAAVAGLLLGAAALSACAKSQPPQSISSETTTSTAKTESSSANEGEEGGRTEMTRSKTTRTTKPRRENSHTQPKQYDLGKGELGEDGGELAAAEVQCSGTKGTFALEMVGDDGSGMTVLIEDTSEGAKNSLRYDTPTGDGIKTDGLTSVTFTEGQTTSSASFIVRATLDVDGTPKRIVGQGACVVEGSSGKVTVTTKPSGSSSAALALPVKDANRYASDLLKVSINAKSTKEADIHAAWKAAGLPSGGAKGISIEATPDNISGFSVVSSKAKQADVLPFAVKDASGRCALGYLYLDPDGKFAGKAKLDYKGKCNASSAIEAFEADDDL